MTIILYRLAYFILTTIGIGVLAFSFPKITAGKTHHSSQITRCPSPPASAVFLDREASSEVEEQNIGVDPASAQICRETDQWAQTTIVNRCYFKLWISPAKTLQPIEIAPKNGPPSHLV